jgi:hypothetical protein
LIANAEGSGSTLNCAVLGPPSMGDVTGLDDSPVFQDVPKPADALWFVENYSKLEVTRSFMDLLNQIFLNPVTIRAWGLVVAMTLGLSGCSVLRPTTSQPPHYFWDSNQNTKQIHAPVACTSLHALLTFNRLYVSGTDKDKLEETTLLGESSLYASDAPPDPPCERAGHPVGPVITPGSTDRVKNITASTDGTVSFEWDFASAVAKSPRQTQTYYTYPEYLVPGRQSSDR